jgi:amino acid adenylation domain-containing protein
LAAYIEAAAGDAGARRVGVHVSRATDLMVALLATQFAGGAYVALDPTMPAARPEMIAAAAALEVVITDDDKSVGALAPDATVVVAGARDADTPPRDAAAAIATLRARSARIAPTDDAYVIFTSGSTGRPRGVAVSHHNLAASTAARDDWFDAPPTRFLVTSSPGFDSSLVGLFWPLATGGTVVFPTDDDVRDIDRLAAVIDEHDISHTLMVPSLTRALLDRAPERLRGLSVSIVAGEACPAALVHQHHDLLPGVALVNEYGPTEATVWATAHRISPDDDPVPIGRPIPGMTARVADAGLHPVPVGVAGELMLSGAGVTAGYLDDTDATASRFVEADGRRWYRTGDLVRQVDGALVFLGRTDDQLNVGGVRLEPAEIERELDGQPEIRESVVVAAGSPPVLVAHLETAGGAPVDEAALRRTLSLSLPAASIPRRFVVHSSLPRTANGKIDRATAGELPLPGVSTPDRADESRDSTLASIVLDAWRRVLAPFPIRDDTDFFAAGGDSLTALALVSDIGALLGRRIAIADLLSGPTPAAMTALLEVDAPAATPGDSTVVGTSVIRPVRFREGATGGPLVVMTPTWDDVFGYQALAEAFPEDVEVVALAYEPTPGQMEINRVPELVAEMQRFVGPLGPAGRSLAILGWSIGGVSAVELAAQLGRAGTAVDTVALIDTFFPGEERHLWSNRWWKYKSMARLGAIPELGIELRSFARRRIAAPLGRRLLRWSGTTAPAEAGPTRSVGSFPAEAFGHQPTPPGVPIVFYRASTTNPERTIRHWKALTTDVHDVVLEGRHRGFDSIMHPEKVGRIASDLTNRLRRAQEPT